MSGRELFTIVRMKIHTLTMRKGKIAVRRKSAAADTASAEDRIGKRKNPHQEVRGLSVRRLSNQPAYSAGGAIGATGTMGP